MFHLGCAAELFSSGTAICEDFHCTLEHIFFSLFRRKAVVGGMSAGAIGQFFASPTDLVKVQMQMEGKRKLEGKPLRSVPLEAGGFFPVNDYCLAKDVVLSVFCNPLSQDAGSPFGGRAVPERHTTALGSGEGGGIRDFLLIPFILTFLILIVVV